VTAVQAQSAQREEAVALSALEQFHPDGRAAVVQVVGSGAVGVGLPAASTGTDGVDLLVVAPSRSEARTNGWFDEVLEASRTKLTANAVVYVVADRRGRRRAHAALKRNSLRRIFAVAHVPDRRRTRYLVPLVDGIAAAGFRSMVAVWPRRRRALAFFLRIPGLNRVFELTAANVGLVTQPIGAGPPFRWLSRLRGVQVEPPVIAANGRDDDQFVLLAPYGAERGFVAKIRNGVAPELRSEAVNLDELGPAVRGAGARLPDARTIVSVDGRTVLVETVVPGTPVAPLLAGNPKAFDRVITVLVDWLEVWHRTTAAPRRPATGELDTYILEPADAIAPLLRDGKRYLDFLEQRCRAVERLQVPFVAVHNDLTMFNVLLDETRLALVDWEAAGDRGLPLTDFAYAMVDAVAATGRYEDRVQAFRDSFMSASRFSRSIATAQLRLVSELEIAPEVAELCLHACWLRHAANDQQRRAAQRDGSFVDIVAELAASVTSWTSSSA
jgi:Ser/Thr protein kinase RdoA (MazF antagonist)